MTLDELHIKLRELEETKRIMNGLTKPLKQDDVSEDSFLNKFYEVDTISSNQYIINFKWEEMLKYTNDFKKQK